MFDLIGAGLGLAGSLFGGSNKSSTTQQLPKEFQGLAKDVAGRAQQIGNTPYTPYPYATVAGFNPYQFAGFDMTANRATGGKTPGAAEGLLNKTLGGGFLNGNPYLQQNIDATLGDMSKQFNTQVAPTMAASALNSGSFGNTGGQQMEQQARDGLAKQMGQVSGGMRMQNYGDERGRQMQAMGMAPMIDALGYSGADRMGLVGGQMQQQAQNVLGGYKSQFDQAQEWPFKTFSAMQSPLGTNIGGTTSTSGPSGNPVAGALGGAMLGKQMGGLFGGNLPFFGVGGNPY